MAKVKHLEAILRKVVEEEKLDRREQFVGKLDDISIEVIPEWIYKLIVAILGNIFQIILVSIVLDLVALMLDGAGGGDEEEGEGGEGGEEGAEGEEGAAEEGDGGSAEEGRRLGGFNGLPNISRILRPF